MIGDRRHEPLEIGVEQSRHFGTGKAVAEVGEAAEIGQPDDRLDGPAGAASD
jgi:hypothetical protein